MMRADPQLIARWATAWAISRGAAAPVPRGGGLYIHVGKPDQVGRYIFADPEPEAIRAVVATIDRPFLFLKVCAPAASVRPLLPPGWEIATPGYMMTAPVAAMLGGVTNSPPALRLDCMHEGEMTRVTLIDAAGEAAAWGRTVALGDVVMFDQIGTAEAHRRRGLGSLVMRSLAAEAARRGIGDAVLCATPAGRALYESLGWSLHSDYTTASPGG